MPRVPVRYLAGLAAAVARVKAAQYFWILNSFFTTYGLTSRTTATVRRSAVAQARTATPSRFTLSTFSFSSRNERSIFILAAGLRVRVSRAKTHALLHSVASGQRQV